MEVWYQGTELKVYKINECEESNFSGKKIQPKRMTGKEKKVGITGGSFPREACKVRGQRSVRTV